MVQPLLFYSWNTLFWCSEMPEHNVSVFLYSSTSSNVLYILCTNIFSKQSVNYSQNNQLIKQQEIIWELFWGHFSGKDTQLFVVNNSTTTIKQGILSHHVELWEITVGISDEFLMFTTQKNDWLTKILSCCPNLSTLQWYQGCIILEIFRMVSLFIILKKANCAQLKRYQRMFRRKRSCLSINIFAQAVLQAE